MKCLPVLKQEIFLTILICGNKSLPAPINWWIGGPRQQLVHHQTVLSRHKNATGDDHLHV
jgi:hypothetical protein